MDPAARKFYLEPLLSRGGTTEGHEISVLNGMSSTLPMLDDFACLIELLHIPDDGLAYLIENFDLRFFDLARDELVQIIVSDPAEFRSHLNAPDIYGQDIAVTLKQR